MNKFIDLLTWFSFLISLVISFFTMIVVFGIYDLKLFYTFYPVEISLAVSFFLWGIDNLLNKYTKNSIWTFVTSFIFGTLLIIFMTMGVY